MKISLQKTKLQLVALLLATGTVFGQTEDQNLQERVELSPREMAPVNLTEENLEGQWVSIINEDWLWRMRIPDKGDFSSIPYNPQGIQKGQSWVETTSGSCLAYGAAGIMRQPLRFRLQWETDSVLKLETDFGQQIRRFIFNSEPPQDIQNTLQGYSKASWEYDQFPDRGFFGLVNPRDNGPQYGSLKVETDHLTEAWLRANGAPVSENAKVIELFDFFKGPDDSDWLVITTIVQDPTYLYEDFVTSSHFRREADRSMWDPRPCMYDLP